MSILFISVKSWCAARRDDLLLVGAALLLLVVWESAVSLGWFGHAFTLNRGILRLVLALALVRYVVLSRRALYRKSASSAGWVLVVVLWLAWIVWDLPWYFDRPSVWGMFNAAADLTAGCLLSCAATLLLGNGRSLWVARVGLRELAGTIIEHGQEDRPQWPPVIACAEWQWWSNLEELEYLCILANRYATVMVDARGEALKQWRTCLGEKKPSLDCTYTSTFTDVMKDMERSVPQKTGAAHAELALVNVIRHIALRLADPTVPPSEEVKKEALLPLRTKALRISSWALRQIALCHRAAGPCHDNDQQKKLIGDLVLADEKWTRADNKWPEAKADLLESHPLFFHLGAAMILTICTNRPQQLDALLGNESKKDQGKASSALATVIETWGGADGLSRIGPEYLADYLLVEFAALLHGKLGTLPDLRINEHLYEPRTLSVEAAYSFARREAALKEPKKTDWVPHPEPHPSEDAFWLHSQGLATTGGVRR